MNWDIHYWPRNKPLRVLIVNPLLECSQTTIIRMLSGSAFGMKQLIDLTLLVYLNEIQEAEGFMQELIGCNFGCLNTIVATSDLPSIDDADVFCFMGSFRNPNILDDDLESDENFDTTYLTLKVAMSLGKSNKNIEKSKEPNHEEYPIIIGDGLLTIDMVYSMGNIDIPSSRYFCNCSPGFFAKTVLSQLLQLVQIRDILPKQREDPPTSLGHIAWQVAAQRLLLGISIYVTSAVQCCDINKICVWGANDRIFHVEIEKPFIVYDKISDKSYCDWQMVSEELLEPLKLDHTQFSASWMKKEFIEKLRTMATHNPYGKIFRGWKSARCLSYIWASTIHGKETCISLGVISDGSLRTLKGLPYYLPLIFQKNSTKWRVDDHFEKLPHVMQEIDKFNKVVKKNHEKLIKYCTKFIEDNIIKQSFIPLDGEEMDSTFSSSEVSQIPS